MRAFLLTPVVLPLLAVGFGCSGDDDKDGKGVFCADPDSSFYGDSDANCATLVDGDQDGFPATNTVFACCCNTCATDCNDGDADVHPADDNGTGPDDPNNDGIDQDCNGVDGDGL